MPSGGQVRLAVRPADCDAFGHVNNAVYASYIEYALATCLGRLGRTKDWQRQGRWRWETRQISVTYHQPASFGDWLQARVWRVANADEPSFGCEIVRQSESAADGPTDIIARASGTWKPVGPTDEPPPVIDGFPAEPGEGPRPFRLPEDDPGLRIYLWRHRVMQGEVNAWDRAHLQAVYQWQQQAVYEASNEAGWPMDRWLAAGLIVLQTRHDTTIRALPMAGELIIIESRLAQSRRWRGTWLQEMRREDGTLLLRDYSTGNYLSLEGRPTNPPEALIADIQGRP